MFLESDSLFFRLRMKQQVKAITTAISNTPPPTAIPIIAPMGKTTSWGGMAVGVASRFAVTEVAYKVSSVDEEDIQENQRRVASPGSM